MRRNGHRTLTATTATLAAPPAAVFPLLCPQREYEWIDTWACNLIYSDSGFAEENCIFTTDRMRSLGIERETWVCAVFEPPRRIGFVRTSEHVVIRLDIALAAEAGERTAAAIRILATGLDPEGDALVARLTPLFEPMYRAVLAKLDHFLATGTMLSEGTVTTPCPASGPADRSRTEGGSPRRARDR